MPIDLTQNEQKMRTICSKGWIEKTSSIATFILLISIILVNFNIWYGLLTCSLCILCLLGFEGLRNMSVNSLMQFPNYAITENCDYANHKLNSVDIITKNDVFSIYAKLGLPFL